MVWKMPAALLFIASFPGVAAAQHASAALAAVGGDGCALCHSSHGGAPGPSNLKTSDLNLWLGSGSARLDGVARSCLRCHVSQGVRAAQPEVSIQMMDPVEGARYLGFDLAGQHPLGQGSSTQLSTGERGTPRFTTGAFVAGSDEDITCTTCHDAHDPDGAIPQPHEEVLLCSGCHDSSTYQVTHPSLACSDCHALHRGTRENLLGGELADATCRSCHDPSGVRSREVSQNMLVSNAHLRATPAASGRCGDCHQVHRP